MIKFTQSMVQMKIFFFTMLKRRASYVRVTLLTLLLLPTTCYPAKAQKITQDDLNPIEMPVGHYIKELKALDDQGLLSIIEDFKATSIDPNQSTTLSLDECISVAFANNPSLKSEIELLKASRDRLIAESRSWNPTAGITGDSSVKNRTTNEITRVKQLNLSPSKRGYTRTSGSTSSYPQSLIGELSWTFLDFSRQPKINAATSNYSKQRYGFYLASRRLIFDIQDIYYQLLATQELINSYEIIAESYKNIVLLNDSRFGAGLTHLGEVGQAHAQFFSTLSDLTQYIERYYALSNKLAKLVSLPGEPLILTEGENQFAGEWIFGLKESIDLAQLNNDRILEALENAKEFNSRGIAQINQTLPSFSLKSRASLENNSSDSYKKTFASGSSNASSNSSETRRNFTFNNNASYDISAGIFFNWRFYQGGVNDALASSDFAQSKSAEFKAKDIRDELIASVRTSINALKSNRLKYISSDAAAQSARISYIASMARLNAGVSDVTTINQLVGLYQRAIQVEINAIQNYNIQLARLYFDTAIWPKEAEGLALELLKATGLPR
ncbi:outer membrane efflux family protein [Synechococcus sp. BIOS-E4-1]|uniref:TolC family protein n=1 Tax=Synechococcus sp. BIOS-E4-1 TaxID=1400864 RepID=UPI0016483A89|nr:TolC family protein [Synechococcus sp. BIOS-E4-1]QNI53643.1 outer membrane efflux family protein [Synechococcus sp. BIOS-E4-1]